MLQNDKPDLPGRCFVNFDSIENATAIMEKLGGSITVGGETV